MTNLSASGVASTSSLHARAHAAHRWTDDRSPFPAACSEAASPASRGAWVPRTVSGGLTSSFAASRSRGRGPQPAEHARSLWLPTRISAARPGVELAGAAPPIRRSQRRRSTGREQTRSPSAGSASYDANASPTPEHSCGVAVVLGLAADASRRAVSCGPAWGVLPLVLPF